MINTSVVSVSDIEGLRADTLNEVRLKVWRRLFSHAEGLTDIINRAGIVPFFSREIMEVVTPSFTSDLWNRMICLSFVKDRGDGTFVLHDLAEDLVRAELGSRLIELSSNVAQLLERWFEDKNDYTVLGLAYAVQANDMSVCENLMYKWADLSWDAMFKEGLQMLEVISPQNEIAYALASIGRGWFLSYQNRIPEGEASAESALQSFKTMRGISESQRNRFLSIALMYLGALKHRSGKLEKAEEMLLESLNLYQKVKANPPEHLLPGREILEEGGILHWLGSLMISKAEYQKARDYLTSSLHKIEKWASIEKEMSKKQISREIAFVLWYLGEAALGSYQLSEAEEFSRRGLEISNQDITVMNNLFVLGWSLLLKGHFIEAKEVNLKITEISRKMFESSAEFPALIGSLISLYFIQRYSGEYHKACDAAEKIFILRKDYMKKAPEVYEIGYINTFRLRGNIHSKIGKLKEAEEAYRKGIAHARELSYDSLIIPLLNDYGVLLYQKGDFKNANKCFREAIEKCQNALIQFPESVTIRSRFSVCLCNLGATLIELDRDHEVEEYLRESLHLHKKIQSEAPEVLHYNRFIASSLNNLAVFLGISNKHKDAEDHFHQALDLLTKNRNEETSEVIDPGLVVVSNNIGILKAKAGEFMGAKDAFYNSIARARELYRRNPETHRQALIQVLCNLHIVESMDDAEHEMVIDTLAELKQLGHKGIPDQLKWISEITEVL